jgi:inosine-uridine nucleoside N-ribohydrolase
MRRANTTLAKRFAFGGLAAAASIAALLLLTFALPVPLWRTGEHDLPPLVYRPNGSPPARSRDRIWVDTDAACGTGRHRDPDDCLALLALVSRERERIAGVSTVFGNAPLEITHATTRALLDTFAPDVAGLPIWRGCAAPLTTCVQDAAVPAAHHALGTALRDGPLTFVALGPLTNLAAVLGRKPHLAGQVRVIAVMGRRPGHLFHPAEGRGEGGVLFGHGPVFRDLNVDLDARAVEVVLNAGVEMILVPYSAARDVLLNEGDLTFVAGQGRAGAWVAERSRDWLAFWRSSVGVEGFYPFDLLTAAFLQDPSRFRCADAIAWVGRDAQLPLYPRSPALLVAQERAWSATPNAIGKAIYCDDVTMNDLRALFTR